MIWFGARDYDSYTSRWGTKDPILFVGRQANLYVYANGDSINMRDANGLDSIDINVDVGAGLGASFGASYDIDSGIFSCNFGFGFGIGFGVSAGYSAGEGNSLSGPYAQGSITVGGFGFGGSESFFCSGGADKDGPGCGASGTVGAGFGAGISLTEGISVPLYDPAWYR